MKTLLIVLLICASDLLFAQTGNVGIGTSTPSTTLDVAGALTLRQATLHVDSAFGPLSAYAFVPANISQVMLVDSAADTVHVEPPIPAYAGQLLTIFNNTTGAIQYGLGPQPARINGYEIPGGASRTFRSTGTTAGSFIPDVNSGIVPVRNLLGSGNKPMLASDYFVELQFGSSTTYVLSNPANNRGRTVILYNGNLSSAMTISSNSGSQINNTGSNTYNTTVGSFSLSAGARTMLISDGTYWIRIF